MSRLDTRRPRGRRAHQPARTRWFSQPAMVLARALPTLARRHTHARLKRCWWLPRLIPVGFPVPLSALGAPEWHAVLLAGSAATHSAVPCWTYSVFPIFGSWCLCCPGCLLHGPGARAGHMSLSCIVTFLLRWPALLRTP